MLSEKYAIFGSRGYELTGFIATETSSAGNGLWKDEGEDKSDLENTIVERTAADPNEIVIVKRRPSGFFRSNMETSYRWKRCSAGSTGWLSQYHPAQKSD